LKQVEIIKANTTLSNRAFRKDIEQYRVAAYCRVSTDSEDQLNSYKSQVQYYTDLINEKKNGSLRIFTLMKPSPERRSKRENIFSGLFRIP